ncbi:metal-dependent phosphohydrolase [Thalassobaculum sp.]|uniref:HD domain-containing protein n=1 Tax=Thalassobaculum sp. TaxID=2022740 RepID=UPI0032F07CC4
MSTIVDEIIELFDTKGREPYGEDVSVAEHGLQCAALADREGADEALVVAALLHDVGHLIEDPDDGYGVHRHDAGGAAFLARHFPEAVVAPVRMHVAAKRYRVAVDPGYAARLSAASTHTLAHQGGPMSPDEVREFEADPHLAAALRLREWDDHGKVDGLVVAPIEAYRDRMQRLLTG